MKKILFFDTETTGLTKRRSEHMSEVDIYPRLVQLGWILACEDGSILHQGNVIVKPEGFEIPEQAARIHGITTEMALEKGQPVTYALGMFIFDMAKADAIVGHNIGFDKKVVGAELHRLGFDPVAEEMRGMMTFDTMTQSTDYCKILDIRGRIKYPKLMELYQFLFGKDFENAHDAMADITATKECYFELVNRGVIPSLKD